MGVKIISIKVISKINKEKYKMKKQTLVSAAVAATMMSIFGLGGLASTDTNQYIRVHDSGSTCYIYSSSGIPSYSFACDASYGSYDASTKTFILGLGVNSTDVGVDIAVSDSVTLTSNNSYHMIF